ncbi:hypothetical protein [Negadavirga shengliensis]|uniref:Uncharacterized protein n=1 Tax=Negadavirga shengliensis TaxID=1389218 RepID=A0ABV9T329_9BACT
METISQKLPEDPEKLRASSVPSIPLWLQITPQRTRRVGRGWVSKMMYGIKIILSVFKIFADYEKLRLQVINRDGLPNPFIKNLPQGT